MTLDVKLGLTALWLGKNQPSENGTECQLAEELIQRGMRSDQVKSWFSGKVKKLHSKTAAELAKKIAEIAAEEGKDFQERFLFSSPSELIKSLGIDPREAELATSYRADKQVDDDVPVKCVVDYGVKISPRRLRQVHDSLGGAYFIYRLDARYNILIQELLVIDGIVEGAGHLKCYLYGKNNARYEGTVVPTDRSLHLTLVSTNPDCDLLVESLVLNRPHARSGYLSGARIGLTDSTLMPVGVRTIAKYDPELSMDLSALSPVVFENESLARLAESRVKSLKEAEFEYGTIGQVKWDNDYYGTIYGLLVASHNQYLEAEELSERMSATPKTKNGTARGSNFYSASNILLIDPNYVNFQLEKPEDDDYICKVN